MLHVSTDAEFAKRKMKKLKVPIALKRDEEDYDKMAGLYVTLMAMNLRRRYCVRTETMTW
jgi:hypothetical protein